MLAAEGVEVGERDVVAPGLDATVTEGTRIAVRFARPVDLTVDGDTSRHWVTATDVTSALDQIGVRYADARLSTSRGATISRSGMNLRVVTPKTVKLVVGAEKPRRVEVAASTVRQALDLRKVNVDKWDLVSPAPGDHRRRRRHDPRHQGEPDRAHRRGRVARDAHRDPLHRRRCSRARSASSAPAAAATAT